MTARKDPFSASAALARQTAPEATPRARGPRTPRAPELAPGSLALNAHDYADLMDALIVALGEYQTQAVTSTQAGHQDKAQEASARHERVRGLLVRVAAEAAKARP